MPHTNKDVLPSLTSSNIIYKFTCRCDNGYVGRTSQRFEVRQRQHVPKSLLTTISNHPESSPTPLSHSSANRSAIAEHLIHSPQCATDFTYDQFSIICKAKHKHQLKVLEALYIRALRPVLCKQKSLVYPLRLFTE